MAMLIFYISSEQKIIQLIYTNFLVVNHIRYFLENEIVLKVSTITIAEYCVIGAIEDLPLRNIQIIPFNLDQAKRTGEFAKVIFTENKASSEKLKPRAIIPNDSKLFAQADLDKSITHFVTSDARSQKTLATLKKGINPHFDIIEISTPYSQTYGVIDFDE